MYLFTRIKPFYFLLAFCIGLFFVYISDPPKKVIVRHPNPQNAGKTVYQNNDESCYQYIAKEVKCPLDKSLIIDHPAIIDE